MPTSIYIREVSGVVFGTPQTVVVSGLTDEGAQVNITFPILALQGMGPQLLDAATVATRYNWPAPGTPVLGGHIPVVDGAVVAAKDTQDPLLRVYTDGGTLHLLFAPATAKACGMQLQAHATQAEQLRGPLPH
jgi:hypothetical protein